MHPSRSVVGVLITFRRPQILEAHLRRLAEQTAGLDRLVVVDNDADPGVASIVESFGGAAAGQVEYLPVGGNTGPAGGIAAGIAHGLETAHADDLLVLLDDDDPPPAADTLESLQRVFDDRSAHDPA
ncbi:MAG: glycosyltransferase family 2 protein, partial [Ilumatobacteraceae bacterium]